MKAKNLKVKPYIIPSKQGNIMLAPAGPFVSIPDCADVEYLKKLAANGMVEISEDSELTSDNEELELLRLEYETLADKHPRKSWKEDRLKEEIEKLADAE